MGKSRIALSFCAYICLVFSLCLCDSCLGLQSAGLKDLWSYTSLVLGWIRRRWEVAMLLLHHSCKNITHLFFFFSVFNPVFIMFWSLCQVPVTAGEVLSSHQLSPVLGELEVGVRNCLCIQWLLPPSLSLKLCLCTRR